MWCLIGHYHDPYGYDEDHDEIVALFTTRQKAQTYLAKSQLKKPRRGLGGKFKQCSLLSIYRDASIEEYEEPAYPVDPE